MTWFVYILECSDNTYYTGITRNIQKRVYEHNSSNTVSAKYTKYRRPVKLVFQIAKKSRSEALKTESEIKKLSRETKKLLIFKNSLLVP